MFTVKNIEKNPKVKDTVRKYYMLQVFEHFQYCINKKTESNPTRKPQTIRKNTLTKPIMQRHKMKRETKIGKTEKKNL